AQARADITSADARFTEAEYSAVLGAKRAYYTALRTSELVRVAETQLRRAREGPDAAERRTAVGSATRSDVLRSQLETTRAQQSVLDAQNQYENAAFALGRLVGADGPVAAAGGEDLALRPLGLDEQSLVATVVDASPSVLAASATVAA